MVRNSNSGALRGRFYILHILLSTHMSLLESHFSGRVNVNAPRVRRYPVTAPGASVTLLAKTFSGVQVTISGETYSSEQPECGGNKMRCASPRSNHRDSQNQQYGCKYSVLRYVGCWLGRSSHFVTL